MLDYGPPETKVPKTARIDGLPQSHIFQININISATTSGF